MHLYTFIGGSMNSSIQKKFQRIRRNAGLPDIKNVMGRSFVFTYQYHIRSHSRFYMLAGTVVGVGFSTKVGEAGDFLHIYISVKKFFGFVVDYLFFNDKTKKWSIVIKTYEGAVSFPGTFRLC